MYSGIPWSRLLWSLLCGDLGTRQDVHDTGELIQAGFWEEGCWWSLAPP